MMLGASRPTVTVVAGTLQKAGRLTYHRGHVKIVDGEQCDVTHPWLFSARCGASTSGSLSLNALLLLLPLLSGTR